MTIFNPYAGANGRWYRGGLHAHTRRSDGELEPAALVDLYAAAGYEWLGVADHDCLTTFEHPRVLCVPAVEVTASGPHMLAVGIGQAPDPRWDRPTLARRLVDAGVLTILNHPNWGTDFDHWPHATLEAVQRAHGLEVFNTVVDRLEGSAYALDRWDRLLSKGRRLWGFANDDFHHRGDGPRAANVVCCEALSVAAVVAALKAGRFYATTGVAIERIALTKETLGIHAPGADHVRFVGRHGRTLAARDACAGEYRVRPEDDYVRVECWGPGHRAAFTQPLFVEAA